MSVDTPEGLKTGSGVVKVTEQKQPRFGSSSSGVTSVTGEAVVIDLERRGFLFALLKGNSKNEYASSAGSIAYSIFSPPGGGAMPDNLRRYKTQNLTARLQPEQMPLMVRFRDINVPSSVEPLDPRNLAASFGNGVRLREVTLTTTSDPVTEGIVKILPWLAGPYYNDRMLDGEKLHSLRPGTPFANSLHSGHFRTGWPLPK